MKAKAKREGPLKIDLKFDEAIRRTLQVKPPADGWNAIDGMKHKRRRGHKSKSK